ncbi:hypothetical protein [Actinomadura darangshiensis]|uniref:hypothetical protein n=1 Tax=Actinomadura darangshiensis TaxID=705336 RepID=UPI00140E5E81|nr:hypothetical protein [Actinomadura darangshiensis]
MYSVGPAVPLAAPHADAPPAGAAEGIGDRTMMVPPPMPSWAPSGQPSVIPDLAMPQPSQPQPSQPQPDLERTQMAPPSPQPDFERTQMAPPSPQQTSPEPPAQPPLQLSVEPPSQAASAPTPATASPLPPADPEDTAAWTFDPDEDSGAYSTPPPPPAWGGGQPALPANEKPALPSGGAPSNPFGLAEQGPPTESIVPDSWFAQPRKPEGPEADATQVWGQQQPGGAQPHTMLDADATQLAPGPMPPGGQGFGGDLDQTRMEQGSPMAAPPLMGPMNQGPMGPGPGPGQMGPGQMGPGQMGPGPMGPGMQPMGQMGPGGPGYGGYPPGQMGPGQMQPGGQGKSGTNKPLVAAVAALVTVAAGAVLFVVWPSGGDDASAGGNPSTAASQEPVAQKNTIPPETKQQAATLNKVLNDSVDTRRILAGALGRAGKCKTLPKAIQGFQSVAHRRTNQLNRTKALKVDKLANGERLRGSLSQALTASLQVDQVLLQWAQANQRHCKGKPKPSAAQVPGRAAGEKRATTAKKQFVVLWNPVAKKTDQPQRSWKRV